MQNASSLEAVIAQGQHIHLAACESHQSAFELTGQHGLFTANLIEVLQNTGGEISFHDLTSRVKFLIRKKFDQSPTLYAFNKGRKSAF